MCRTFEVNASKPQLGLHPGSLPGKTNVPPQASSSSFFYPVFYMGGSGYNPIIMPNGTKEEVPKEQMMKQEKAVSQTPSVVSAMTPAEFPFPNVSMAPSKSQHPMEMVSLMTDSRPISLPNPGMNKFLLVPCDDNMSLLQPQGFATEKVDEPLMRYHSPATNGMNSLKHRASCHRCGNLRKKNVLCTRCPHTFCHRCADKMQEEHGPSIFEDGCPVCKDLCCCGKNRSLHCPRKFHCYKKCPCTKRQRPQQDMPGPSQVMVGPAGSPYYPAMMNMMAPQMTTMSAGYFPQSMYEAPASDMVSHFATNMKPCSEPEWPVACEPQKQVDCGLGKHSMTSGEDTTSASEFEDFFDDDSNRTTKRIRCDNSSGATSSDEASFSPDDEDALAALLCDDTGFEFALQELDYNTGAQDVELLSLSDDQLFDLLATETFDF